MMAQESETPAALRRQFFVHAAAALAGDARLFAPRLAAYRAAHGLEEVALAAWLGLPDVAALHGLALCRWPNPATTADAAALTALATYVGCDAARLRELITACADLELGRP